MLNAFGVLVHQIDLEHVGRRIVAVVPHSFLGVDLCPFQDGMDACMLTIVVQEVVHPVTIPPLDDIHAHTEPLANVDIHHFDSHIVQSYKTSTLAIVQKFVKSGLFEVQFTVVITTSLVQKRLSGERD